MKSNFQFRRRVFKSATSKLLLLLVLLLPPLLIAAQKSLPDGGLRFSSYEEIKDLRTGINFTPDQPLEIRSIFQMNFDFAFRRSSQAYGHIFRIIGSKGNNIDLISSPYNSKFDDLNLILGDSVTAVSFGFEEINMIPNQWIHCKLIISLEDNFISLTLNEIEKTKEVALGLKDIYLVFGKNELGAYTTSDVPPMDLKEVAIRANDRLIRHWPLTRYNEDISYDETERFPAKATNPHWMIDRHFRWRKTTSITTQERPQIIYNGDSLFYLLTPKVFITYNVNNNNIIKYNLEQNVALPFNQASLYKKEIDEIWCYDLDSLKVNKFKLTTKSFYEVNSRFTEETHHWHANRTLTNDNRAVFFGGYGFYTYTNELIIHEENQWKTKPVPSIEPRYLSALGRDHAGNIYVLGGYGSKNGSQEYGSHAYKDLYKLDLSDFSATPLWNKEAEESEANVYSSSMVFSDSDSMLYVLRYPRDKFNSKAVLESYNVYTGEFQNFGDSLDIDFLDTNSFIDLIRNYDNNTLMAVAMNMNDEFFETNLYSLNFPPISNTEVVQPKPLKKYFYYAAVVLVLTLFFLGLFIIHRKKSSLKKAMKEVAAPTIQEATPESAKLDPAPQFDDKKGAILFLGGFQVLDKNGDDISEKFSQTLRTLLTMLLLFSSNKGKGVPSNFIWENLWGDKNQSSARNNRNVNIKKLRDLLQNVGEIEIKSSSDKWKIFLLDDLFFDYRYLMTCIEENRTITSDLINLVKRGNILPTLELDWIDSYKADLSNKVVDYLLEHSKKLPMDSVLQMEIANCIFQHDIINQDALFIKIKHLNAVKKFALAKQCYETYSKEYKVLYGEPFDIHFEEILKDEH